MAGQEIFGKTGTTDHTTDAWFIGANAPGGSRQLATAVWFGNRTGNIGRCRLRWRLGRTGVLGVHVGGARRSDAGGHARPGPGVQPARRQSVNQDGGRDTAPVVPVRRSCRPCSSSPPTPAAPDGADHTGTAPPPTTPPPGVAGPRRNGELVTSELDVLLTLQEHDTTLERLLHRHHTLPERDALRNAEARRCRRSTRASSRTQRRARQGRREEQQLDDEARSLADKAKEVEARMYSGEISSPKELQAMQADVEQLREHQGTVENRELELMEVREPLDATVARPRAAARHVGADVDRHAAALGAAEAEIIAEMQAERASARRARGRDRRRAR